MSTWQRIVYAFFASVVVVGTMTVVAMIVTADIGDFIFSWKFFVPTFVVAYLLTPILARRIKFR